MASKIIPLMYFKTVIAVAVRGRKRDTIFIKDRNRIIKWKGPRVAWITFLKVRDGFRESIPLFGETFVPVDESGRLRKIQTLKDVKKTATEEDCKRFDYLKSYGIVYLEQGWIRIRRWRTNSRGPRAMEQNIYDINAAIRMQGHILDKYKEKTSLKLGEVSRLYTIKETLAGANDILSAWKDKGGKNRDKLEQDLTRLFLLLGASRNRYKISVFDQLSKSLSLKDRRGIINPPAMAARTVAMLNYLDARLKEIRIIMPRIALRKEILEFEKGCFEAEKNTALILIKSLLNDSPERLSADKKNALVRINRAAGRIYRFWASPYYCVRHLCLQELREAEGFIGQDNIKKARYCLHAVRHILSNEI